MPVLFTEGEMRGTQTVVGDSYFVHKVNCYSSCCV